MRLSKNNRRARRKSASKKKTGTHGRGTPVFTIDYGDITQFTVSEPVLSLMKEGRAARQPQEQFLVLEMLAETGKASPITNGFAMRAEDVCEMSDEDAYLLGIPAVFPGRVLTDVRSFTTSSDFRVELKLVAGQLYPEMIIRTGPVISYNKDVFRITTPLLHSIRLLEEFNKLPLDRRTEAENVRLVARLQAAQDLISESSESFGHEERLSFSLGALDSFETVNPVQIGLTVAPNSDGSLSVDPNLGVGLSLEQSSRLFDRLDRREGSGRDIGDESHEPLGDTVIRDGNSLVLLGAQQQRAIRHIRSRRRIPAGEVETFLQAPGAFFDPDLVDVDIGFGVHVRGLGIIAPITFTDAIESGLDWFGRSDSLAPPEALARLASTPAAHRRIEKDLEAANDRGDKVLITHQKLIDISDGSRVERALEESRKRFGSQVAYETAQLDLEQSRGRDIKVGLHVHAVTDDAEELLNLARAAAPSAPISYDGLGRSPFPHQAAGIEWLTGLIQASQASTSGDSTRIRGALLADDMGLGKTFMMLVAMAEAQRLQGLPNVEILPSLVVMPLSLLEGWLAEIESTFGTSRGPFTDVIVLQGEGISHYLIGDPRRETTAKIGDLDRDGMVRNDRIHPSLRVGSKWGDSRLDRPGVIVLTTYETLRRYQVSLGVVQWGVVVFDEAQVIKNPQTLVSRAANGLKAQFKLAATGTPVENSLRDFWSLFNTVQPGLLGSWSDFESSWIALMTKADRAERERLGKALRERVGAFMLRRDKEDHLHDLPSKYVHEYRELMPKAQVEAYDAVLAAHRSGGGGQGAGLKTLHRLSMVSLHPSLLDGGRAHSESNFEDSARTLVAIRRVLDHIHDKKEKVIIFAVSREIQRKMVLWVRDRYGVYPKTINGDTPATRAPGSTRTDIIRAFERVEGFNVIIMSPLAAGVGLTVVGANHVIHMERLWNPAKEAQATDRVYRIGQTRDVHVHIPIGLHPNLDSFDVNLKNLLLTKIALKDAVVINQEVGQREMERILGL